MKAIYSIVGMRFRKTTEFLQALPKGEPLLLKRDRANQYDPFAVQVWARDTHIGFVKAIEVKTLAAKIDGDVLFEAALANGEPPIARLAYVGGWPSAEVEE